VARNSNNKEIENSCEMANETTALAEEPRRSAKRSDSPETDDLNPAAETGVSVDDDRVSNSIEDTHSIDEMALESLPTSTSLPVDSNSPSDAVNGESASTSGVVTDQHDSDVEEVETEDVAHEDRTSFTEDLEVKISAQPSSPVVDIRSDVVETGVVDSVGGRSVGRETRTR
jgi:hypothetical protein